MTEISATSMLCIFFQSFRQPHKKLEKIILSICKIKTTTQLFIISKIKFKFWETAFKSMIRSFRICKATLTKNCRLNFPKNQNHWFKRFNNIGKRLLKTKRGFKSKTKSLKKIRSLLKKIKDTSNGSKRSSKITTSNLAVTIIVKIEEMVSAEIITWAMYFEFSLLF